MRSNVSWVLLLALAGCAGRLENRVRREAAEDLSCSESDITVQRVSEGSGNHGKYSVTGCGATGNYFASCLIFCEAKSEGQVAEDRARDAAEDEAYARRRAPEGGSPAPTSNLVSGRLLNLCDQKVLLWRGEQPNGSGRSDSLGSNTSISLQGKDGEKIWIVDSSSDRQGVDSFTLVPELKELYIDASCRRFTTER